MRSTRLLSCLRTCLTAGLTLTLSFGALVHADEDLPQERAPRKRLEPSDAERDTLFDRPGERRPGDQYRTSLFGRELTLGGEYEIRSRYESDFRLGSRFATGAMERRDDDEFRFDQKIELEAAYALGERMTLFAEASYFFRATLYKEAGGRNTRGFAERGETWLYIRSLFDSPWSLQIGRQRFSDEREWFWDEDLDAIRLHFDRPRLHLEFGAAQRLVQRSTLEDGVDPRREDVTRLVGRAELYWAKDQRLELFYLDQRDRSHTEAAGAVIVRIDEDPSDADLTWFGVALRGDAEWSSFGGLEYWIDTATVRGSESFIDFDTAPQNTRLADSVTRHDVQGWAIDVGISVQSELPARPTFTLGYARGSGDRRTTRERDSSFRQTGLQDNNVRFSGVDRFRAYGELLDPELSNLALTTAAIGFPLLDSSSIELLYHHYRQAHAAPFLRASNLKREPDGRSRRIGQEIDLILGLEESEHLELEVVGSIFRAGSAFGRRSGDQSYYAAFKLNYNF